MTDRDRLIDLHTKAHNMTDKKLTDSEMERLYASQCSSVEWCKGYNNAVEKANVIINRLQAENEQYKDYTAKWMEKCDDLQAENERLKSMNQAKLDMIHDLREENEWYIEIIQTTKAEAYKEFAERLKLTFPKDDFLRSTKRISEDIDNLLKELVGETDV